MILEYHRTLIRIVTATHQINGFLKEIEIMATPEEMWQCQTVNCGYIYNPDKGDKKGKIPKGTKFDDLPDDWKCPICGATRKCFRPLAGPGSSNDIKCVPLDTNSNK